MAKKTEIKTEDVIIYPQEKSLLQSRQYDAMVFSEMVGQPIEDLRKTCSLLTTTIHAEYYIGTTFIETTLMGKVISLEISVVKQTNVLSGGAGYHRVNLNNIATQYGILQNYVTAGIVAQKFMQNEITWAEYKRALTELLPGDVV
jgi:hypothetical protein